MDYRDKQFIENLHKAYTEAESEFEPRRLKNDKFLSLYDESYNHKDLLSEYSRQYPNHNERVGYLKNRCCPSIIEILNDSLIKTVSFNNNDFLSATDLKPADANYYSVNPDVTKIMLEKPLTEINKGVIDVLFDYNSNFKLSSKQAYVNLYLTGNNACLLEWSDEYNNFRIYQLPLNSVFISGNDITHEIDKYFIKRDFRYSQLRKTFNSEELENIYQSYGISEDTVNKNPNGSMVIACVFFRSDNWQNSDMFSESEYKPFISIYFNPDNKSFIKLSGYDYMPILYSRTELKAGDIYGHSRFEKCESLVDDIVTLNIQIQQAIMRNINEKMFTDERIYDAVVNSKKRFIPVSSKLMEQPLNLMVGTNRYETTNIPNWMKWLDDYENRISRIFKQNQITQQTSEDMRNLGKTATEVAVLTEASNQWLAMVIEDILYNYINPIFNNILIGVYIRKAPYLYDKYPKLKNLKLVIELQDPSVIFNNINKANDIKVRMISLREMINAMGPPGSFGFDNMDIDDIIRFVIEADPTTSRFILEANKVTEARETAKIEAIEAQATMLENNINPDQ